MKFYEMWNTFIKFYVLEEIIFLQPPWRNWDNGNENWKHFFFIKASVWGTVHDAGKPESR